MTTQKEIKAAADSWAILQKEIAELQSAYDVAMEPYLKALAKKTKSIREEFDGPLTTKKDAAAQLQKQICDWLEATNKAITLKGELAVAENIKKAGKRVISAETFFKKVTARTSDFWQCVTIGIEKARALIGDSEVDKIATKPDKYEQQLRLK